MSKKPEFKNFIVDIQFHTYERKVRARTAAEAKKKVIAMLQRRGVSSLVDKKNTYVDKL